MKSNESFTTQASDLDIVVPYAIKLNILKIKQTLKDNINLTKKLILKCMTIGNTEGSRVVYYDDIEDFIFQELKEFIDQENTIFRHSFNFSKQTCCDSEEIKQIHNEHVNLSYKEIRQALDSNINNLLENLEELESTIIGDL